VDLHTNKGDSRERPATSRITLDLSLPPSINRLWKIGKNRQTGKRFMMRTPEYEKWLTRAGWELAAQRPALPIKSISGHYSLIVRLRLGNGSDLDNRTKALSDLLQEHRIIDNDKMCRKLLVLWQADLPVACRVTIRPAK